MLFQVLLNRFLICIFFSASTLVIAGAPQIVVEDKDEVDFGAYPANKSRTKTFTVKNSGDALLKIKKVRNTCLCAVSGMDKKELKPGESSELKVTIKKDSIYGVYKKYVFIMTDDPEKPTQRITVKGNAIPIASVSPQRFAYAGVLKSGSKWEKTFFLAPTEQNVEFGKLYSKDDNCKTKLYLSRISDYKYSLKVVVTPKLPVKKGSSEKTDVNSKAIKEDEKPGFKSSVRIPVKKPDGWKSIKLLIMGEISD